MDQKGGAGGTERPQKTTSASSRFPRVKADDVLRNLKKQAQRNIGVIINQGLMRY